ncbi:hypothetical protein, partial [Pseudorhodoferax sp.]|uniref:hypothetical protein n=1 Tax=Pseudorhodoferax sp. TaxID=1993553 RepID=UPI002DD67D51
MPRLSRSLAVLIFLLALVGAAPAQEPDDEALLAPSAEAQAVLQRALPTELAPRLALLDQQMRAAQALGLRAQQIALARRLVDEGRGQAEPAAWGEWLRFYLHSEFTFGQATRALDACEPHIADATLPLGLRAGVALRQTYMAAHEGELEITLNHWRRAQGLLAAFRASAVTPTPAEQLLGVDALQVRAEVVRLQGRHEAAVATLREALKEAQALQADVLHERNGLARHPDVERVAGWVDGSRSMLVYALVRQGRAAEA